MGASSLGILGCTSPVTNHLHLHNEIPHLLLSHSTHFLERGWENPNAPDGWEPQFQSSTPLVAFSMDNLGQLTYGWKHERRLERALPDETIQGSKE